MPPLIIEEDDFDDSASEDLDTIPAKKPKGRKPAKKAEEVEEDVVSEGEEEEAEEEVAPARRGKGEVEEDLDEVDDGQGDDDDEEEEEMYAVEKVLDHGFLDNGTLTYKVKWLGYDTKSSTWESEENLQEGAADLLEAYNKKIGGRPEFEPETKGSTKKGRAKRKLDSEPEASPAPSGGKRGKRTKTEDKTNGTSQALPTGDWEQEVKIIETIEDAPSQKSGTSSLRVYLVFTNGHKTAVAMSTVRQRCPQKLLDYYEQHLTFRVSGEVTTEIP